ncbi:TetR/AcrR family transcriptional regulator [Phytomonospora endophytica]|uniref:AcrR family transcriptional regulator n=1 Tax=Phytomonospora endophytica TaxID=714109 RepID=A0A841FIY0_9ACTN|nr:TetR/AcrR family transcriptional regulator [Phytomonospora endophytica]MBB6033788.1 AcrR family transcriptional regulator [Phytomonospora endophytica]GIG64694.1 TetR family transcriptional regulator [Phytomonospora endophytica]
MRARPSRKQRTDARDNRERILTAAGEVYRTHGIDAPVTTIARHAGLAVATVYRHFPGRDALAAAVFTKNLGTCREALDDALADPDPWRGLTGVIATVAAERVTDSGFTGAYLARNPDAVEAHTLRDRAETALATLVARAKATGRLRADFHPADIGLVLAAADGLRGGSPAFSVAASRRLLAYLLQSFAAENAAPLPPPAGIAVNRLLGTAWTATNDRAKTGAKG